MSIFAGALKKLNVSRTVFYIFCTVCRFATFHCVYVYITQDTGCRHVRLQEAPNFNGR